MMAISMSLYERVLNAPTQAAVDEIVAQESQVQNEDLIKLEKSELYKSYLNRRDTRRTYQGAQIHISESLGNHIRSIEPQKILNKVVLTQKYSF